MCRIVGLLIAVLGCGAVMAQQAMVTDPTRPLSDKLNMSNVGGGQNGFYRLNLQAIVVKQDSQYAIINDQTYGVGDALGGMIITNIDKTGIEISNVIDGVEMTRRIVLDKQSDIKKHATETY
ncbi:hypothetical protein [Aestuariibacter salexigens]|uniref:hypothetical protein n=1 Tax=Aestuariibacter salexigens TaxID=226010 RepID=UPI0012EBE672|nr:hypothetical protein [Aestuariibacter salexigens]